jgi:hypothetical protein
MDMLWTVAVLVAVVIALAATYYALKPQKR